MFPVFFRFAAHNLISNKLLDNEKYYSDILGISIVPQSSSRPRRCRVRIITALDVFDTHESVM